jgi:hypothetical protein
MEKNTMVFNLQELKTLIADSLSDDFPKMSELLKSDQNTLVIDNTNNNINNNENETTNETTNETKNEDTSDNENDIPDLITPPDSPKNNNINREEYTSCLKILDNTDNFIYKSTNTLFILLLCNDLFNILTTFDKTSLSLFILNSLMFLFYNSNKDVLIESQSNLFNNSNKYFIIIYNYVKNKFNYCFNYFMNYFFSKNTQLLFKFAYNMTKMKVINTYNNYKNNLLNPPLFVQTNKDNVYIVSYYLNGQTYKIPVIEPRFSFDRKQQALMVLNANEDDVTQKISKYMGPNNDFYGIVLKPSHLAEKSLNFMMEDGSELNVGENDIIVL